MKMKTILVDAVDCFVIEEEGTFQFFKEMQNPLENFPNKRIILTGANDEQFKKIGLDKMPWKVFTLKHDPEKTDPSYYERMLEEFNLIAEDAAYFKHNKDAVKSTQLVGITTYHYYNNSRDLAALEKFLDEHFQKNNSCFSRILLCSMHLHTFS